MLGDTKRILRKIERMPSTLLTEWERGFVFGALHGEDARLIGTMKALVDQYEAENGAFPDDLKDAA